MNTHSAAFGYDQPLRAQIKGLFGETLGYFLPKRFDAIRKNPRRDQSSLLDRLLVSGVIRSSTRKGDLTLLSEFHRNEWKQGSLQGFYDQTSHRFQDWFLKRHIGPIEELEQLWRKSPEQYHTIVEIGCGAGQVIQYLGKRFPQAKRLVGLDVCTEQIQANIRSNACERTEYYDGNAGEWITEHARPNTVFVSNGGVLEYFSPQELEELFTRTRSLSPSMMITIEPIARDHKIETDFTSRPFGNERSFSHNYPYRLIEAGFAIEFQDEVMTDEYRFLLILAT